MYAGCGYAGDLAGDPLLNVDVEKIAWIDVAKTQARTIWTGDSGLPAGYTWITYMDGILQERGAVPARDFTVPTPETMPNLAAVAVASGVSDGSYDPLGSENVANLVTLAEIFRNQIRDQFRIEDDSLDQYELFKNTGDNEPDLSGLAYETFSSLPHTTAALSFPETHRFILCKRNKYGMLSQNRKSWRLELDGSGLEVAIRPSAPKSQAIAAGPGGAFVITAEYEYKSDGDNKADTWLIYLTTGGGNPDPAVDTPVEVTMKRLEATELLNYTSTTYPNGTVGKVIVRTRREGTPDVDSNNSTIAGPATADAVGPSAPSEGGAFFGAVAKQE